MFNAADVETEDQSAPVLVSRVKRARWPSKAQQDEERAAKRLKQLPFRHSRGWGQLLTVGQGDTGQLGLGEDVMEKSRPGLITQIEQAVDAVAGGMVSQIRNSLFQNNLKSLKTSQPVLLKQPSA